MTEAQKYEGAMYKEKATKNQRKGKNEQKQNAKPNGNTHHRAPYVEDATDVDDPKTMHPPATPAQKSSAPANENGNQVNVFDFMVPSNASKATLAEPKEQMRMMDNARSVSEPGKASAQGNSKGNDEKTYDGSYEENGFSYGSAPIAPSRFPAQANASTEFVTPVPKKKKDRSRKANGQASAATSEKKRKRRMEDVDMDDVASQVEDTPMMDAPSSVQNHPGTPLINHSGLTGGFNRMMRSPSVEGEEQVGEHSRRRYEEPVSPIKRTRRNEKETNHDSGIKGRAERFVSSMFGGSVISSSSNDSQPKTLVRHRRRSSSDDENRPPSNLEVRKSTKTHKIRNPSNNQVISTDPHKNKRKTSAQSNEDRPSRRVKHVDAPHGGDDARDMVIYRQPTVPMDIQRDMAGHFMALVTKGPDSSRGFSVNKILKRFHKDFSGESEDGQSLVDREQRIEDEKELWRTLRLKRNERGEIVVFL